MGKSLEEMKIDELYELLDFVKEVADDNMLAALKWAIFELESKYCNE